MMYLKISKQTFKLKGSTKNKAGLGHAFKW